MFFLTGAYERAHNVLMCDSSQRPLNASVTQWRNFIGLVLNTEPLSTLRLSLDHWVQYSAEISDYHNVACPRTTSQHKLSAIPRKGKSKDDIRFEVG